jgi:hypothetical protein
MFPDTNKIMFYTPALWIEFLYKYKYLTFGLSYPLCVTFPDKLNFHLNSGMKALSRIEAYSFSLQGTKFLTWTTSAEVEFLSLTNEIDLTEFFMDNFDYRWSTRIERGELKLNICTLSYVNFQLDIPL